MLLVFTGVVVRLYIQQLEHTMQTQTTQAKHKQKQTNLRLNNTTHNKYSSPSRNLKDIYSLPSGGLEDVLYLLLSLVCLECLFLLLFCLPSLLSFCMYKLNNYSTNKQNKQLNIRQQQTNKQYSSSSRNLKDVYSRPSGGLDVMYLCVVCVVL